MSIKVRQRRLVAATPECARERNADNPSDPACVAALGGQRNFSRLQEEKSLHPLGEGFFGDLFEAGRIGTFWFLPRKQGVQAQAVGDYVARTGASYYTGGASEAALVALSGRSGGDVLSTAFDEPKLKYSEAVVIGAGVTGGLTGAAGGTWSKIVGGVTTAWNAVKTFASPTPITGTSVYAQSSSNRSIPVSGRSPINGGSDYFSAPYQSVSSGLDRSGGGGSFFTSTKPTATGSSLTPSLIAAGLGIIAAIALLRLSR